ncbi:hypothetical protein C0993_001089 [Termitomyces sp. T159_Od127]|nr:hypothetical protein C0993_001089 [Termitomyces sp. T159_Od127]
MPEDRHIEPASEDKARDDDTDDSYTYAPTFSSPEPPLSAPHMMVTLEVMGPAISSSPLSIRAMLDNGCPSTVISNDLVKTLGLRRFRLHKSEDNLTSLTENALRCKEYVRLEATVGNGAWRSAVFRAKVNVGLPVPLILGIPFLSAEKLVLDINDNTAVDKRMGFDIVNTRPLSSPPTHPPAVQGNKGTRVWDGTTCHRRTTSPHWEDHAPPEQIMALIQEQIETLSLEEELRWKDNKAKQLYADCFPSELPKTSDEVPNHIYHRIRLKDPLQIVKSRGYGAPKKFHEP